MKKMMIGMLFLAALLVILSAIFVEIHQELFIAGGIFIIIPFIYVYKNQFLDFYIQIKRMDLIPALLGVLLLWVSILFTIFKPIDYLSLNKRPELLLVVVIALMYFSIWKIGKQFFIKIKEKKGVKMRRTMFLFIVVMTAMFFGGCAYNNTGTTSPVKQQPYELAGLELVNSGVLNSYEYQVLKDSEGVYYIGCESAWSSNLSPLDIAIFVISVKCGKGEVGGTIIRWRFESRDDSRYYIMDLSKVLFNGKFVDVDLFLD